MSISQHSLPPISATGLASAAMRGNSSRRQSPTASVSRPDLAEPRREEDATVSAVSSPIPTPKQMTQLCYAAMARAIDRLVAAQKEPI